jgi:Gluconate 2-dehydrogenase subunit 3
MNRRDIIRSMGLVSSHLLFPSILSGFIASCEKPQQTTTELLFFEKAHFEAVREIIDMIIPATKTKSASEVNVHLFLDEIFAKCMAPEQQSLIKEGLGAFVPNFSTAENKGQLLAELDKNAFGGSEDAAWFRTIKQYTLVGFFTSQEGETKASNYVKIPGDYKPDVPVDENTLNYGKTGLQYYL